MTDTPLLAAVDYEGEERFVVVVMDFAAGAIRQTSRALTEEEARQFFADKGETAAIIAKRFQSAFEKKGRV